MEEIKTSSNHNINNNSKFNKNHLNNNNKNIKHNIHITINSKINKEHQALQTIKSIKTKIQYKIPIEIYHQIHKNFSNRTIDNKVQINSKIQN